MSYLDDLEGAVNAEWAAIRSARGTTIQQIEALRSALGDEPVVQCPTDTDLVVFGSIAREEVTSLSDVDWTLLLDGQADPEHHSAAQAIAGRLRDREFTGPNPQGAFGHSVSSHDLIHLVGGEADTNRNTTQRILLLLESSSIHDSQVRERVIRGIVNRYLEEDTFIFEKQFWIPRFLLNDVVRFWRTMAVDYAAKQRERERVGWALRNAKLRFSRKLVFIKGLLMCFDCHLSLAVQDRPVEAELSLDLVINHLMELINLTPMEILARATLKHGAASADLIFGSYDEFLGILNDEAVREDLKKLDYSESRTDRDFDRIRVLGRTFQDGLNKLFYDSNATLTHLTQEYGVF